MKESLKSCGMKTERGRIRSRQIAGFFGTVKAKRILALILTAVLALVTA